jgi:hypothetical protein
LKARIAILTAGALSACTSPQSLQLRDFERVLASDHSATAALTSWCRSRRIADPPVIAAQRVKGEAPPTPPAILALLQPGPAERIAYRHVRLTCGAAVLSVAQNWYLADRLSAEMNHTLDTTDMPFGRVIAELGFTRERLDSAHGRTADCPADTILMQHALLRLPDGRPVSAVVECYSSANLPVVAAAR